MFVFMFICKLTIYTKVKKCIILQIDKYCAECNKYCPKSHHRLESLYHISVLFYLSNYREAVFFQAQTHRTEEEMRPHHTAVIDGPKKHFRLKTKLSVSQITI